MDGPLSFAADDDKRMLCREYRWSKFVRTRSLVPRLRATSCVLSTAHEVGVAAPSSTGTAPRPLRLLGMRIYEHDRSYMPMVYECL